MIPIWFAHAPNAEWKNQPVFAPHSTKRGMNSDETI